MILQSGCATLRAIEEKDADLLLSMINDPYIDRLTTGLHLPLTLEQEITWIIVYKNDMHNIRLMIELSNQKTIGLISLTDINLIHRTGEYGIKISAPIQDRIKNDVFDASIALINFAFFELGLNCIIAKTLVQNTFSLKLQQKLGFEKEGILRERIFTNGQFNDLEIRSLLKNNFLKQHAK